MGEGRNLPLDADTPSKEKMMLTYLFKTVPQRDIIIFIF